VDGIELAMKLFVVGGVGLAGSIATWVWRRDPRRRARRLLTHGDGKPLGAIAQGERARVHGVVSRGEQTLEAPFTRRRCVAYRMIIEVWEQEDGWREVSAGEESAPFELISEGIGARVEGPFLIGLEFDARSDDEPELSARDAASFRRLGIELTDSFDRPRRLRYREAALEPGDPIWVLGRASVVVDPSGRRESPCGQPVKRVIRGTERDPVVIADEVQPGVLDSFE
jgi:hypothetical protein